MIKLCTLGGIDLRDPHGLELRAALAQPKRFALLTYLAVEGAVGSCRRDTLVGLFWPEADADRSRASLRQALRFLRREVDPEVIATGSEDNLRIDPTVLCCDATEFVHASNDGRLAEAFDHYQGDFLAGLYVPDSSPEFDDWLIHRRHELRHRATQAAAALGARSRDSGQLELAARWTRSAIALSPDDEELQRALFTQLYEAGNRAGAIRAYEEFAIALRRRLGVPPSAATQALITDMRAGRHGRATDVPKADRRRGIAVLNFLNMTGDPQHDYVCHGFTEEIRAVLSKVDDLRVVPVTGGYALKGREPDLEKLRTRLNVDAVLDGMVWREGITVRVSAHLIDVNSGEQLWADSQERPWQQVDSLLIIMVRALSRGIQQKLTGRPTPVDEHPTPNVEAYRHYLKGRFYWSQRPRRTDKTLQSLAAAIESDPDFALAHAGLADAYNTLGAWEASVLPPTEAFPKAQAAAARALELDPRLAEAHTAMGYANLHYHWNWSAAESQLLHALALKPHYGNAHHWLSHVYLASGRLEESLRHSQLTIDCDPLDVVFNAHLGWHFWMARRYDEMLEQCERTAELDPNEHWVPLFSGFAYIQQGKATAAIDAQRLALQRSNGSPVVLSALGYSYAVAGERKLARGVLTQLEESGGFRGMYGYEMSIIHGALGDSDAAFEQLNRAVREHSSWLAYLAVEPRVDRLRDDPRFPELLRTIGLGNGSKE